MGILSRFKAALAPIVEDAGYPRISASIASPRSGGSYLDYSRSAGRYYADGAKWANGLSSNGSAPIIDHTTMRANARSASHDSLAARGILQRFAQTVVDRGVRIECAPIASMLGITEEEAEAWATDHETRFDLWARSQTCTVDESMTFYQAQRALMYMRKRDGEYFVRCYYDPRRDLLNPLRLGIIDPNQIQGDALTDSMWARTYGDGIDRDEYGREVAFNVLVQHADGTATREKIPAVSPRTGLPFILHGFSPEYAGQSRGFSAIGHALQEIENLGDFEAATIKKAINQAAITMYVKPGDDAPALNPLADYASGAVSGYQAAQAPTTATSELAEDPVSYSEMNDVVLRPGSVGVFNLQEGEDLVPFNSTAEFCIRNVLRDGGREHRGISEHASRACGSPLRAVVLCDARRAHYVLAHGVHRARRRRERSLQSRVSRLAHRRDRGGPVALSRLVRSEDARGMVRVLLVGAADAEHRS